LTDPEKLHWIEAAQTIAIFLIAIGGATEFVGSWIGRPIRQRVQAELEGRIRATAQQAAEASKKAEEERLARVLAAGVVSFTTAAIMNENRFAGIEHHEQMLRRRDELQKVVADAGLPTEQSQPILDKITHLVDWDLRKAIAANTLSAWHPINGESPTETPGRTAFQTRVEAALQQPDRLSALDAVEDLLGTQPHITNRESIDQSLSLYRGLLTSGRLPRIGPSDDLQHAPIE
jgi:hypothetical protein